MSNGESHNGAGGKAPPDDLTRLIKLMGQTTSDNENVSLIAIRAANAWLSRNGITWDTLLRGKVTIMADPFAGLDAPPSVDIPKPSAPPVGPRKSPHYVRPTPPPRTGPMPPPRPQMFQAASPPPQPGSWTCQYCMGSYGPNATQCNYCLAYRDGSPIPHNGPAQAARQYRADANKQPPPPSPWVQDTTSGSKVRSRPKATDL